MGLWDLLGVVTKKEHDYLAVKVEQLITLQQNHQAQMQEQAQQIFQFLDSMMKNQESQKMEYNNRFTMFEDLIKRNNTDIVNQLAASLHEVEIKLNHLKDSMISSQQEMLSKIEQQQEDAITVLNQFVDQSMNGLTQSNNLYHKELNATIELLSTKLINLEELLKLSLVNSLLFDFEKREKDQLLHTKK